MNAIEISGLTKRYADFTLDSVSLKLPEGCILGLIGENGAGKTTLMRLLLGMTGPDGGTASVLGQDVRRGMSGLKEQLGVVMDEPGLPDCMTARQTGKMLAGLFNSWDAGHYAALLKKLHVPEDKAYGELSRGTRMKLGIAAALAHHPRLLLLDEPTSGLDPVARGEMTELLFDFTRAEDRSVLLSSHIVSDLEKLCDYAAFLHRGRLMLCEEKDALLEEYSILRCTAEELAAIPPEAVLGKKENPYGVSAVVRRGALPKGAAFGPVTLEELFVCMAKEGER